jgi:uncharacterized protein (DUF934 family)
VAEAPAAAPAANMIRDGQVERDITRWFESREEDEDDAGASPLPPDEANWAVPLAVWTACRRQLRARRHWVGIQVLPDDDVSALVGDAPGGGAAWTHGIAFIAIRFPVYTDGRGFSLAQLLRGQHGWAGEMRAVGDVLIDTVHYLQRCGFNSFVLKAGHDPLQALKALQTFSAHYQRSYRRSG